MTDVGSVPLSRQTTTQQQPPTSQLPTTTSSLAPTNIASGPPTSLTDPGTSPRPRDARTIHILLASLGVTAYQERVPLQLLDFAYRYTSSVLSDAHHLTAEGYVAAAHSSNTATANSKKNNAAASGEGDITIAALRLATASRNAYQFSSGALPKEALLEVAGERNRIRLPDVDKDVFFGVRLPHERYVQTGTGWGLMEEWDSEEEVSAEQDGVAGGVGGEVAVGGESKEVEDEDEDMEDQDEGFEQVFGGDKPDGDGTMEE